MKHVNEIAILRVMNKVFLGLPKKIYWALSEKLTDEISGREIFLYRAFRALSFNGIHGDYAEFGCAGGLTFALAYRKSRKNGMRIRMWAFDSFRGLPPSRDPRDEHPKWSEGAMATGVNAFRRACRKGGIPERAYTIVAGFYEDSLADTGADLPDDICLAYIDCDLFTSTAVVLRFLAKRLKHGMILAFDDYYCWSSTQPSGERSAVREFLKDAEDWRLVPYMQFGWHGMSFVVEEKRHDGGASICH